MSAITAERSVPPPAATPQTSSASERMPRSSIALSAGLHIGLFVLILLGPAEPVPAQAAAGHADRRRSRDDRAGDPRHPAQPVPAEARRQARGRDRATGAKAGAEARAARPAPPPRPQRRRRPRRRRSRSRRPSRPRPRRRQSRSRPRLRRHRRPSQSRKPSRSGSCITCRAPNPRRATRRPSKRC